ncbi:MAG: CBS domain-containing protein [Planctomycetes bacterium]|nr:CBS domain-containing protein [Planctomycetota bacterium]
MHLAELMTTKVQKVASTAGAQHAYALMRVRKIHHLAVEQGGKIVGVLSERDLGGVRGATMRRDKLVSDLMARDVVTATPGTTLHEAAAKMRARSIGSLLVTDGKALCGIVTVSDLLGVLANQGKPAPTAAMKTEKQGRPRPAKTRAYSR